MGTRKRTFLENLSQRPQSATGGGILGAGPSNENLLPPAMYANLEAGLTQEQAIEVAGKVMSIQAMVASLMVLQEKQDNAQAMLQEMLRESIPEILLQANKLSSSSNLEQPAPSGAGVSDVAPSNS